MTGVATGTRNRSRRSTMCTSSGGSQTTVVVIWYDLRTTNCAGPLAAWVLTRTSSGKPWGATVIWNRKTFGLTHDRMARTASSRSGSGMAAASMPSSAGQSRASVPSTRSPWPQACLWTRRGGDGLLSATRPSLLYPPVLLLGRWSAHRAR